MKHLHFIFSLRTLKTLLFVGLFLIESSIYADEWRGFRGLEKQAFTDTLAGPTEWSETKNVLWKVDIEGEGYSSPVVSGSDVIITSARLSKSKAGFYTVLFYLLLLLSIVFILKNIISLFQGFKEERNLLAKNFTPGLLILVINGLVLFSCAILYWMYFNESRTEAGRIFTTYLFSGAVLMLCAFMVIIQFQKESIFRIITGLVMLIFSVLFLLLRPLSDYYTYNIIFNPKSFWVLQLIVPSVLLPILFSLFLLYKTMAKKRTDKKANDAEETLPSKKVSFRSAIVLAIGMLFLSISGFMIIPIISLSKFMLRDHVRGILTEFNIANLFSPDFAYPFFLGFISIGFLAWFVFENHKSGYKIKSQFLSNTVILCCVTGFFIMLNFTIRAPEYKKEIVCLDRNSGKIKWIRECLVSPAANISNYNSHASPTALIDSTNVYAYFGSSGLISLDRNGDIQWENKDLPFESIHGVGTSPVFSKSGVIIYSSMPGDSYLASVNSKTGKEQWKTILPPLAGTLGEYRTPVFFELNGQELIIEWSAVRREVVFYDSKTGKVAKKYLTDWETRGESVATPVVHDSVLYLTDQNNVVAFDMVKFFKGELPVLWLAEMNGRGPLTASPVVAHGLIFTVSDNGFVSCLDSKDGMLLWQKKFTGSYFSSPVVIGDRVYFSNGSGMTTVVECSSEYRLIAENILPEGIYATLVPVDDQLFIRTKNSLWCLKNSQ